MTSQHHTQDLSPQFFFDTINAYQRTAALRAAIELDLFSAVAEGCESVPALAGRCEAAERGIRILCDYLTIFGMLEKEDSRYRLSPEAAAFLDRRSPRYLGAMVQFLLSPALVGGFEALTAAVRKGGTASSEHGTLEPEHPAWVTFARSMVPMMAGPAEWIASHLSGSEPKPRKVLDIAAGHGMFGIEIAKRVPEAVVSAVDWPNVLEVAVEHAGAAGVRDRYRTISGSALAADFGTGHDVALLTNFLHHFDVSTCEELLRKVHAALAEGGRVVTLEFVPNEDRITPGPTAAFSLIMLATTPAGDAYTLSELDAMFRRAGFGKSEIHEIPNSLEQVVISYK